MLPALLSKHETKWVRFEAAAILKYDASSVPVVQLGLSREGLTEQHLYDLGLNFIRTRLATVQGASLPLPWRGKSREAMFDLDPDALFQSTFPVWAFRMR
jgi:hypothetical protein